jgi:hypothetical protein
MLQNFMRLIKYNMGLKLYAINKGRICMRVMGVDILLDK